MDTTLHHEHSISNIRSFSQHRIQVMRDTTTDYHVTRGEAFNFAAIQIHDDRFGSWFPEGI
jgi:hypothetical protein